MDIVLVKRRRSLFADRVESYLREQGHEVAAVTTGELKTLLARYPDGGGFVSPDVLIDLRVGGGLSDVCGMFYVKQPSGLVVHVHGLLDRFRPHIFKFLSQPVLHCSVSAGKWKAGLTEVLGRYERSFGGWRPGHEIYPGKI